MDINNKEWCYKCNKNLIKNPEFPQPINIFIYNEKYPAKVRGMAYEIHYGVKISKSEFGGAWKP